MVKKKKAKDGTNRGRNPKITAEVTRILEYGFHNDFTVEEACRNAGISTTIFYEAQKKDSEFLGRMQRAMDFPFIMAKKNWIRAMKNGQVMPSVSFLERRQRDRYASKTIQEHQGAMPVSYAEMEQPKPKAGSVQEARARANAEN